VQRRAAIPIFVVAGGLALLVLLGFGVFHQATSGRLDDAVARGQRPPLPAATLPRLDSAGSTSLASLRGKVVVLNVFASWCSPCADEAPVLERAQRRLAAEGATMLGVTWRDTAPDAQAFVRRFRLSYPVVRDVSGDFAQKLSVVGVPETFVIDRRGRIAAIRRQPATEAWFRQVVEPLARAKA
jgi:cytochrome c biogenesis protein CcmG/thiol:disulfide interchange protein DsbE